MSEIIPTVQPAEHCGELSPTFGLIGQPAGGTECVLRPSHSGSHADEHGMRWREIVHDRPPLGSGLMPCCGLSPAETPGQRQTTNPEMVTCSRGGEVAEWTAEQHAGHGSPCETRPDGSCARPVPAPERCRVCGSTERLFWRGVGSGLPYCTDCEACECGENPCVRTGINDPAVSAEAVAVLAVQDAELQQLREELARFHESEEPHLDEAAVATPAQWIWRWNRATPAQRLEVVEQIQHAQGRAHRCLMGNHEGQLDELREARADARQLRAQLARVREWLPVIRRALSSLPEACRYHGDQLDPDRFGRMTRSEACCDTGIPARRRREAERAVAALDPKEQP